MSKKLLASISSFALLMLSAGAANAHFQLVYTPDVNLEKPQTIPVKLIFWHPMENGHVMDMEQPEQFFYVFKDEKIDLAKSLKPIVFSGKENQAKAFEADVNIRRNGDYIFVLHPAPYYEKSEDAYIQQITKSYVNKGGIPAGWEKPVGLPTEIVPLNKPTNVLAGSTFTGQVLTEGKPAAGVEIEIEYLAAPPDVKANRPSSKKSAAAKGGEAPEAFLGNSECKYAVGVGYGNYSAALGSGPNKEYKGKELSQDAVIWIRADKME